MIRTTVSLPRLKRPSLRFFPAWTDDRSRTTVYAFLLIALGGLLCFSHLGAGMLEGDEAAFALTTHFMLETGDWVVPTIDGVEPHLNAAPLYNWLTCLTAPFLDDSPLRYRLWSAVLGILCAAAVLMLGRELFSAEVGLLAGFLLLSNQSFLFLHGVRSGVMEPGLMLFHTVMVCCYARASRTRSNPAIWWSLIGVNLGLAVLIKPPAFGGFFFGLLCLHHVLTRTDLSRPARFQYPLLAAVIGAAIALPWYLLITQRVGLHALQSLFIFNSVTRTAHFYSDDPAPAFWFYLDWLQQSSKAGKFFLPALGLGLVSVLIGWRRFAFGLLTLLAGAFLLAISSAQTKHLHYSHNALPYLCVLTAALLACGTLPPPESLINRRWTSRLWKVLAVIQVGFLVYLVQGELRRVKRCDLPVYDYPAVRVERAIEGAGAAGEVDLVFYRFREPHRAPVPGDPPLKYQDLFYVTKLPRAKVVHNLEELNQLLAAGKPIVLFLPAAQDPSVLQNSGLTAAPDRVWRVRANSTETFPVLTFNGAANVAGVGEVLDDSRPVSN
jgi:4-amino-4-deoxy-L-arabinose transferase-like glycosyltransferase